MLEAILLAFLYGSMGILILCMLFLYFEKPLMKIYFKWSDNRFYKKTGINPSDFPEVQALFDR